jgi:pimeloyl-ACP methyl ester carboxylesterase
MSVVILQNKVVHYEVLGRGRPLVFLHSWVGSWRYWIPTMQAASISFRSYALDQWGFGDTSRYPECYTIEGQSLLLEEFIEKLGIGKVGLVGHGLGSLAALDFTARNPHLVDRVLGAAFPLDGSLIHPRLQTGIPSDLADWLLVKTPGAESARLEALKADVNALTTSVADFLNVSVIEFLKMIETPCLLVHGQNDPAVLPAEIEIYSNLPDNIHSIFFEQSGHFPMLDEASKFHRLLLDFLSLGAGESARNLQLKDAWKRRVR